MNKMGDPDQNRGGRPPGRAGGATQPVRRVSAAALFEGGRELIIEHGSEEYRLRLTSKGKLILTK